MQTTYNNSPTVRITSPPQSQSMLAQPFSMAGGWNDSAYLSAIPKNLQHKRGSSGSSVASAGGPPSPLSQNTLYPHIATSDSTFPTNYEFDYTPHSAKSLPADMSMFNQPNYRAVDMRRIHSSGADDRSYNLSAPQSVSTMSHNSPATPHTAYETEYDEKVQYGETDSDDELMQYLQMDLGYAPTAAYQQSLQEVFPDGQFTYQAQPMPRMTPDHRQTTMAGRLQAAQADHMSSPTSNPRGQSPFRHNSPYVVPGRQAAQPATLQKQRTSVSPKELMLDEHDIDESAAPLFQNQQMFGSRRNPSNLSNYYTPTFNTEPSVQIPQQYPFVSQQSQNSIPDSTPDFPAHLISMESTADEGSAPSSQQSQTQRPVQRPADVTESATYSCTYHGCYERFETPAKLQKHKREGHRQISPQSSASPNNLANRNSQAGPHRCDRINPSTGKPCNSIFSRPYDLTRHEDTIHNGRKIKVRCHLCTEEKTFSRNDALTRHMRVVHPDVNWVGKQKRKSKIEN